MNPQTQSPKANERFIAAQITRYGGIPQALTAVRHLRDMDPSGQPWWCYIEANLAYQLFRAMK